ncbi:MAG: twin-arginine translocase TatA/TatE family subunit [Vicinamibacterales bacterium]
MPFGIGIWEMLILLLVLLLVFGPKRLPEMGRQLGRGMREFKETISGENDDHNDAETPEPLMVSVAPTADPADVVPAVPRPVERVAPSVALSPVDEPKLTA